MLVKLVQKTPAQLMEEDSTVSTAIFVDGIQV